MKTIACMALAASLLLHSSPSEASISYRWGETDAWVQSSVDPFRKVEVWIESPNVGVCTDGRYCGWGEMHMKFGPSVNSYYEGNDGGSGLGAKGVIAKLRITPDTIRAVIRLTSPLVVYADADHVKDPDNWPFVTYRFLQVTVGGLVLGQSLPITSDFELGSDTSAWVGVTGTVPLPAGAGLLASGIGLLTLARRRKLA